MSAALAGMQPAMDVHTFIATCERLLIEKGRPYMAGGSLFNDGGLHVHRRASGDLTITLYYGDQKGKPTLNNPVIMRSEEGELYRCHGEWRYGIPRVQQYVEGGSPTGLIDCPNYYYYITDQKK